MIRLKRAYEPASDADGYRILVDNLWPRGVPKKEADIDLWAKEIAPSPDLRKWFAHDPEKWDEFKEKYKKELEQSRDSIMFQRIKEHAKMGKVTLVYATKDEEHNNAIVLKDFIEHHKK